MKRPFIKLTALAIATGGVSFQAHASADLILGILIKAYEAYKAFKSLTDITKLLPENEAANIPQANIGQGGLESTEFKSVNPDRTPTSQNSYYSRQEARDKMMQWYKPKTKDQRAFDQTTEGQRLAQEKRNQENLEYKKDFKVHVYKVIDLLGKPISELNMACYLDKTSTKHNLNPICDASTVKSKYSGVLSYQASHPNSAEDVKMCIWALGQQTYNEESTETKKQRLASCDKIFDAIVLEYKQKHNYKMTDFSLNKLEIRDVAYFLDPHIPWNE